MVNYNKPVNQPTILIVDDTPEHIETAVAVLRNNNFHVRVATKGNTALKLLEQHMADLILLDIYMPEINGFEICQMIKNDPAFRSIPIIFLTSLNDEASISKGFQLGAQDYVTKPFNTSELLARVNTHIKLKRQAESLQHANNELDSFCYSVAHDLKSPLLSLNKLTEYLAADYADKIDPDGQELISNIQEKSQEVIQIIDHLLDLSRMCERKMDLTTIDLSQLFSKTYTELVALEPVRDIEFTLAPLPTIQGDALMLKLLVQNILSNALKYTRHKATASIKVTATQTDTEFVIAIQDNGAGFDMKYSARLFNIFQRLHSNNEFEGSGIGLAICQKILKRHHGTAWITGKVNEGASFYFSLRKNLPTIVK
ncbi:response regulator [Sporomusa sp. KB1]|jgi:signal transduction histidine kinase|uniref:response regulator n=1 Tax=Sporomusa sp. KB1 TaxID=943346 RepID=UPI0011A0FC2C|nr:response regulator [Sporomusa sp. KB1]TWH45035.1 Bacteriophytochrome (light-regulated signal transduction histidine kinase) [Sporomusa sp. KB1]